VFEILFVIGTGIGNGRKKGQDLGFGYSSSSSAYRAYTLRPPMSSAALPREEGMGGCLLVLVLFCPIYYTLCVLYFVAMYVVGINLGGLFTQQIKFSHKVEMPFVLLYLSITNLSKPPPILLPNQSSLLQRLPIPNLRLTHKTAHIRTLAQLEPLTPQQHIHGIQMEIRIRHHKTVIVIR
jgi:uncharacterized paraquat-inducible protein A